jgi:hypothetical protein
MLKLWNSFKDHCKIAASQWYALRRVKQMEREAAEEDRRNVTGKHIPGNRKKRRRTVIGREHQSLWIVFGSDLDALIMRWK